MSEESEYPGQPATVMHLKDSVSCFFYFYFLFFFSLMRLETVFAVHRVCTCETEPSDLYPLRETTLVGQLLLLSCTGDMIFGRK